MGSGARAAGASSAGFDDGLSLRGADFEGLRRVYFVVMRVWEGLDGWWIEGEEGRRTVEGRAWRRREDWVSQVSALSRYGIVYVRLQFQRIIVLCSS